MLLGLAAMCGDPICFLRRSSFTRPTSTRSTWVNLLCSATLAVVWRWDQAAPAPSVPALRLVPVSSAGVLSESVLLSHWVTAPSVTQSALP